MIDPRTEDGGYQNARATCTDCGQMVVFRRDGLQAHCETDPAHQLGPEAQRMLEENRRRARSR